MSTTPDLTVRIRSWHVADNGRSHALVNIQNILQCSLPCIVQRIEKPQNATPPSAECRTEISDRRLHPEHFTHLLALFPSQDSNHPVFQQTDEKYTNCGKRENNTLPTTPDLTVRIRSWYVADNGRSHALVNIQNILQCSLPCIVQRIEKPQNATPPSAECRTEI